MTALATTTQLAERLSFVMDEGEIREATGALEDLSDEARFYGKDSWVTPEVTPQPIVNLILRAAKAHMNNYNGYTTSRAGDETVSWGDDTFAEPGRASFTTEERTRIREHAGRFYSGFHSVNMFTASPKRVRAVPTSGPFLGDLRYPPEPW